MAVARNNAVILSAEATSALVNEDATIITLWDASTSGNLLQEITISNNPDALVLNARYQIAANAIVLTQPVGTGEKEEMAKRALRGRVKGGVWIQFHDGAPGTNGTGNVIALARVQIQESQFTVSDT